VLKILFSCFSQFFYPI